MELSLIHCLYQACTDFKLKHLLDLLLLGTLLKAPRAAGGMCDARLHPSDLKWSCRAAPRCCYTAKNRGQVCAACTLHSLWVLLQGLPSPRATDPIKTSFQAVLRGALCKESWLLFQMDRAPVPRDGRESLWGEARVASSGMDIPGNYPNPLVPEPLKPLTT